MIDHAVILAELARVKATFQLRAIAAHLGKPPLPATVTHDGGRLLAGGANPTPGLSSDLIPSTHSGVISHD